MDIRGYQPVYQPDEEEVRNAAAALNSASRPLFFIGGGVHISGAASLFTEIAEEQEIPVVSSLMGISAIPSTHPLYLGMIGMHGTFPANNAVSETDLLFSIGVRFDDRATGNLEKFAPKARIVHVDIDPTSIARNVPVDISVVGDAKETLQRLKVSLIKQERSSWFELIETWKSEGSMRNGEHNDPGAVTPENVNQGTCWLLEGQDNQLKKLFCLETLSGSPVVPLQVHHRNLEKTCIHHLLRVYTLDKSGTHGQLLMQWCTRHLL